MALNTDRRYHIQLKRTKLPSTNEKIENYPLVFGEPVYLQNDEMLVMGEAPAEGSTTTNMSDCNAVKLVSQHLQDPENVIKYVNVVENGVHFKNRGEDNSVDVTDNKAVSIFPRTKLTSVKDDNGLSLDELLLRKVNIDSNTKIPYPSLGYDEYGVYVYKFNEETASGDLSPSLVDIVNRKVSIDSGSAVNDIALGVDIAESQELLPISMGVDLGGVYVTIPPEEAKDLTYVQAYIDAQLNDMIENRMTAVEGSIYYLQEMLKNNAPYHRGARPPEDKNKLWIDTASVTGGLKYCSDKQSNSWSHVAVAYT